MAVIWPWRRFKFTSFIVAFSWMTFTRGGLALSSEEFYPFGEDNGDDVMPKQDDAFVTIPLRTGTVFPFYNESYTSLFVSTNGAISFRQGIKTYTPTCTPESSLNQPMVTPFWADVDTTSGGDIFFRETKNATLLQTTDELIRKQFPERKTFKSTSLIIVTWSNVAFYGSGSPCGSQPRNSFQVVLSTDGDYAFAMFHYGTLQWTTGTALSGSDLGHGPTPAKAGFDRGDGQTFFQLPGSCTAGVLNVALSSNMNENGKWIMQIVTAPQTTGCDRNYNENTKLDIRPSSVRSLGHIPLKIRGICLDKSLVHTVTCRFHDLNKGIIEQTAYLVEDYDNVIVCQVPFLYSSGRIKVDLFVSEYRNLISTAQGFQDGGYKNTTFTSFIYVTEGSPDFPAKFLGKDNQGRLSVNLQWNPKLLPAEIGDSGSNSQLDLVQIHLIESDGDSWKDTRVVQSNVLNSGNVSFAFSKRNLLDLVLFRITRESAPAARKAVPEKNTNLRTTRGTDKYPKLDKLLEEKSIFSTVSNIYEAHFISADKARERCDSWYESDPGVEDSDLEHCPPLLSEAQVDTRFTTRENIWLITQIHDKATASYIQRTPAVSGAGRECVYGKDGRIIVGPPDGGASNMVSPLTRFGFLPHLYRDVLPYYLCCKTKSDAHCRKYYEKRSSSTGTQYVRPKSARAIGEPHVETFDRNPYSFNGVGEFWMIKAGGDSAHNFSMQARMEPVFRAVGQETEATARASVFTAFVMTDGTTKIQIQISSSNSSDLEIILDDDLVVLDDDEEEFYWSTGGQVRDRAKPFVLPTETATVEKIGNTAIVSYSIGFSFTITAHSNVLELTSLATSNIKKALPDIQGLLGNIDGDGENDLRARNGTLVPANSTLRTVHYEFGLSWMTSPNESLFLYPEGKHYGNFSDPQFEPNLEIPDLADLPPEVVTLCNGSPECLFDYAVTGSLTFAKETLEAIQTFDKTVDILEKTVDFCEDITSFENGHATFSNLFEGSSIFFECEKGSDLVGEATLTCIKDETSIRWSGSWPKCFKQQEFICPTNGSIYPCTCTANSLSTSDPGPGPQFTCSGPKVTQTTIEHLFKALRSSNSIPIAPSTEPQPSLKIHKFAIESTNLEQLNLSPLTQSRVKVTQLNIHGNLKLVSFAGPFQEENDGNLIDALELSIVGSGLADYGLDCALSYFSNTMNFLTISESKIQGPSIQVQIKKSDSEFLPRLSTLTNLTYLNLDHNQIRRVPKHAFTSFPKLRFLSLSNNLLGEGGEIKVDAFVHESQKNLSSLPLLFIRLAANRLTIKNFNSATNQPGSIETVLRPLKLDLTYNQLNRLTPSFFQPLLLANPKNQINVRQNPIMCNRLMQWLKDGALRFQRQVLNVDCKNDPHKTVFTSRFLK